MDNARVEDAASTFRLAGADATGDIVNTDVTGGGYNECLPGWDSD